jgi:hypothetical protein
MDWAAVGEVVKVVGSVAPVATAGAVWFAAIIAYRGLNKWRAELGHAEMVEMLIKRGADQSVRDKGSKTALDLAANDNVCVDRSQQLGERARAFWSRSQETAFGTVTSHAALISP